jgi:hypothetical protein
MANVEKLHWHELPTPKAYGISVKTQMLQIQGRILPAQFPSTAPVLMPERPLSEVGISETKDFYSHPQSVLTAYSTYQESEPWKTTNFRVLYGLCKVGSKLSVWNYQQNCRHF